MHRSIGVVDLQGTNPCIAYDKDQSTLDNYFRKAGAHVNLWITLDPPASSAFDALMVMKKHPKFNNYQTLIDSQLKKYGEPALPQFDPNQKVNRAVEASQILTESERLRHEAALKEKKFVHWLALVAKDPGNGHFVHTPLPLAKEMISKLGDLHNKKILVMFNLEFIWELVKAGVPTCNIWYIADNEYWHAAAGAMKTFKGINNIAWAKGPEAMSAAIEETGMKFDVVIGNPPYDSLRALHQQFFVKAFGLLNDEGMIAFIQPANPYFNKKNTKKKQAELEMQDIIREHCIEVHFKNEDVFENAQLGSKLAITYASPKKDSRQIKVQYQNGVIETTDLSGINQLAISGDVYKTIREKLDRFCEMNGNFYDANKNKNGACAKLPKVRGHAGQDDFNTFIPTKSERTHYTFDNHDFGIPLEDVSHLDNFYDYLETDFARACLALVKMDINLTGGELRHVPMVDFSKKYSEDELFQMAGLTDEERKILIKLIPDYYHRRK